MQYCPTEILIEIFPHLHPKHLVKCREVCKRWNEIINDYSNNDDYWQAQCKNHFTDIYEGAYKKRKKGLSWKDLYRSLYLWSKIKYATEIHSVVASSVSPNDIYGFQILRDGKFGVHTKSGIVYYDIATRSQYHQDIPGEYLRYAENDNAIIILASTWDIYIIRKVCRSPSDEQQVSFSYIKHFIVNNDDVYYVTLDNDIYVCNILTEKLESRLVKRMVTGVICLGVKDGLHVLTYNRGIYTIIDNKSVFQQKLSDTHKILDTLNKYNFIENLMWQSDFNWVFRGIVPKSCLREINVIKMYGDMVFVGSNDGLFSMYNTSNMNSQFDLFGTIPIKHYYFRNFERPYLKDCPIVHIDVIEGEDSHKVLVGMPRKIKVLQFNHK